MVDMAAVMVVVASPVAPRAVEEATAATRAVAAMWVVEAEGTVAGAEGTVAGAVVPLAAAEAPRMPRKRRWESTWTRP